MTDYIFNIIVLAPSKIEKQYLQQTLHQLISTHNEISLVDAEQLLQGVAYSFEAPFTGKTVRLIIQVRPLSEQSFGIETLTQLGPSAVLLIVPKELQIQNLIGQTFKQNQKAIKQLRQLPMAGVMDEKGFVIGQALMKQLTEAAVSTELSGKTLGIVVHKLIQQRIEYGEKLILRLGDDYEATQEKSGCGGM